MTLLIDADYLLHSSCAACETDVRWSQDIHTLHLDEGEVKELICLSLDRYREMTGHSGVIMCFSDYPTFRHEEHQDYKANRINKRKPLGYKDLRNWLSSAYISSTMPGLEADDVMGLLATGTQVDEPVMVSPDKDMRTVPGLLLAKEELEVVTLLEANRTWMKQTLTGDSGDNYSGVKGVGPVAAEKILGDAVTLRQMWPKVVAAYQKSGLTFKDAILNARLARILRHGDYDYEAGRVRLWDPASEPSLYDHE